MAKQGLIQQQKQIQRLALEQQRMLGEMLEKNDAEMAEFVDNKVNEIQALEKKQDEDGEADGGSSQPAGNERERDDAAESENSGDDDTAAWYRYVANNRSHDDE